MSRNRRERSNLDRHRRRRRRRRRCRHPPPLRRLIPPRCRRRRRRQPRPNEIQPRRPVNHHDSANGRHALNRSVARARPSAPAPDWRLRNPVLQSGDAASEQLAAAPTAPPDPPSFALADRQNPIQQSRAARAAYESTEPRTRQRSRRRAPRRRLSPRRDRREPNRRAGLPSATQNTRSNRQSPREPLSKLQTMPHDDSGAARSNGREVPRYIVGRTSCRCPANPSRIEVEVARSDGPPRGPSGGPAMRRRTPEASLSREGSYGSIDSPGRLTRRAPRFGYSWRRSTYSCGAAPVSHRLPRANLNEHYAA